MSDAGMPARFALPSGKAGGSTSEEVAEDVHRADGHPNPEDDSMPRPLEPETEDPEADPRARLTEVAGGTRARPAFLGNGWSRPSATSAYIGWWTDFRWSTATR